VERRVFREFPFLDAIARGEVDALADELADGVELSAVAGMSMPESASTATRVVEDLNRFPLPDLEALPDGWGRLYRFGYHGVRSGYLMNTSRGCPYSCSFCMVGGIRDKPFRFRKRDPANVVEEARLLRTRYGVDDFYVVDEIFNMPGHGERVAEALVGADVRVQWCCEAKPDLVDPGALRSFQRAGCYSIFYGVESADPVVLENVEKGHTVEQAERAVRLTKEAGIQTGVFIMFGFPDDDVRTYLRTVRFILDTEPHMIRYDTLLPYPTTTIHEQMVDAGLLSYERTRLDRRIATDVHGEPIAYRTRKLSPAAVRCADFLFKQLFAEELASIPTHT